MFQMCCFLFDTVYSLWSYPYLLPAFTTWPPVLHKLAGGAGKEICASVLKETIHCIYHLLLMVWVVMLQSRACCFEIQSDLLPSK